MAARRGRPKPRAHLYTVGKVKVAANNVKG